MKYLVKTGVKMQFKMSVYICRCWSQNYYCAELNNRICDSLAFERLCKDSDVFSNGMIKSFVFKPFSESSTFNKNNF